MNAKEFVEYWSQKEDVVGRRKPTVGIDINWRLIPDDSRVDSFFGQVAWDFMGRLWPPVWGNFKRTRLEEWLNPARTDYELFIEEETNEGKIKFYRDNGLPKDYREFCAFVDKTGKTGILGDGNHRYINCNYLMIKENKDLTADINKCRLDIVYLKKLTEVLSEQDLPPDLI